MRVFSASLGTETNTFSPLPTGLAAFQQHGYDPSDIADADLHPFAMPMRAMRERGRRDGWTMFEGKVAFAMPAGVTTRKAYEFLRDQMLDDIRAALPLDIVLLGLHGAMVADGYDDAEGDLLARVRELVGPNTVIGAELDPHCHLTATKCACADLLVLFKEYPHTDMLERARELLELCVAAAQRRVRPVKSLFDCRMINVYHTTREPMRGVVDRIKALEGRDGVLSVSIAHGFPWGDVADLGTRVLVTTDDRRAHGDALAAQIGAELLALRDQFMPAYPGCEAAIDEALAHPGQPVVLADSADNPGAGAAGDSTFMLRSLLQRPGCDAVLGPLWDPVAVMFAFEAGEGARLRLRIGGKCAATSGEPLDAEVEVIRLARDVSQDGLSGTRAPLGDVALVRIDGVRVVLNSTRTQAFGTDLFTQFGVDLASTKLVVVKSSQHFYAKFGPLASKVIYVDSPGTATTDFASLPWRKAPSGLWPLCELQAGC
jgi:microcystin degradation protein MlrC